MSFEEKTKILVTEDKEQWERFFHVLRTKGAVTNLLIQHALIDFVQERERTMRVQEDIEKYNDEREEQQ